MIIERLNSSVYVLSFLIILFGGVLSVWRPEVGHDIILLGGGAFGGSALQRAVSAGTLPNA